MKQFILIITVGLLIGGASAWVRQYIYASFPALTPLSSLRINTQLADSYKIPRRLTIPALGINVPVEQVGLDSDGRMEVPENWNKAGWYTLGPLPGNPGNAVIAGHYDSPTGPALFTHLGKLDVGDEVVVTAVLGSQQRFKVVHKQMFPDDQFPVTTVFGTTSEKNLNLITCEGAFDQRSENYTHRLVVFTRLMEE